MTIGRMFDYTMYNSRAEVLAHVNQHKKVVILVYSAQKEAQRVDSMYGQSRCF